MEIENPIVKQFSVLDVKSQDKITVYLGPEVAIITNTRWPRNPSGEVTGIGEALSITIPRQSLIGLAYEILKSV